MHAGGKHASWTGAPSHQLPVPQQASAATAAASAAGGSTPGWEAGARGAPPKPRPPPPQTSPAEGKERGAQGRAVSDDGGGWQHGSSLRRHSIRPAHHASPQPAGAPPQPGAQKAARPPTPPGAPRRRTWRTHKRVCAPAGAGAGAAAPGRPAPRAPPPRGRTQRARAPGSLHPGEGTRPGGWCSVSIEAAVLRGSLRLLAGPAPAMPSAGCSPMLPPARQAGRSRQAQAAPSTPMKQTRVASPASAPASMSTGVCRPR